MSINWISFTPGTRNFTPLPGEQFFFNQDGVRLDLAWGGGYPGNSGSFSAKTGTLHLTNRRIVYIPTPAQPHFQSLTIPLNHAQQGRLSQPWFGVNYYTCVVYPVYGGGIKLPSETKFYFHEGGAFEFSTLLRQFHDRIQETGEFPTSNEPLPQYHPSTSVSLPEGNGSTSSSAVSPLPNDTTGSGQDVLPSSVSPSDPPGPTVPIGPAGPTSALPQPQGSPVNLAQPAPPLSLRSPPAITTSPPSISAQTIDPPGPPMPAPGEAPPDYEECTSSPVIPPTSTDPSLPYTQMTTSPPDHTRQDPFSSDPPSTSSPPPPRRTSSQGL